MTSLRRIELQISECGWLCGMELCVFVRVRVRVRVRVPVRVCVCVAGSRMA